MQFSFSSDQREFAASLREMLERECTAAHVRAVWDDGTGHDPKLWARLAEMGVLAMTLPERDGGLGGTLVDGVLLIEELGRAAAPGPVMETMALGGLAFGGTRWAAGVAAGEVPVAARLTGDGNVAHLATAAVLLEIDEREVRAVDVGGLSHTAVAGIDGGRRLSALDVRVGVRVGATDRDVRGDVALDIDRDALVDAGSLATAAYLLGLSSRMLAIAGDYARDRRQFGQPIGAFQAVKHLMADALLQVEFARPAIYRAAWSHATGHPDRARDVSMAKALASDAAQKAARSALQVHGAIGYTWECDLQLFMKKAWALIPAWGSASMHRRRVADAVLGARR